MPTVIDSLVVELGIDPSKFTKGQKEALDSLKKFEEGANKSGKNAESSAKKYANMFQTIKTGIVGFATGLTGNAMVEFITKMNSADAAIGRTAYTLNMSAKELATWQVAAKLAGGSAESITSALTTLSGETNTFLQGGGAGAFLQLFGQVGVSLTDANNKLRTADVLFTDLAGKIEKYEKDPARRASLFAKVPGMNAETINLFIHGEQAFKNYLAQAQKIVNITPESIKLSIEYSEAMVKLDASSTALGRTFTVLVTPALITAADALTKWLGVWTPESLKNAKEGLSILQKTFSAMPAGAVEGKASAYKNFFKMAWKAWTGGESDATPAAVPAPAPTAPAPVVASGPRIGMTRADRNNNPGNIKSGSFANRHGATGSDGTFAIFPTPEAGRQAMDALLASSGYAGLTMEQLQRRWVGYPHQEYLGLMTAASGVPANGVPDLQNPATRAAILAAMARGEGAGARRGANLGGVAGPSGGGNTTTVTNTTNINTLAVYSQAGDAPGIAKDIASQLSRNRMAVPANGGAN